MNQKKKAKIASHTKEVCEKRQLTNINNHEGVLAWNSKEAVSKRIATITSNHLVSKTKLFISINNNLNHFHELGISPTKEQYTNYAGGRHMSRVFNILDFMKSDDRWTDEMNKIFI